jgi:hypothetical protein
VLRRSSRSRQSTDPISTVFSASVEVEKEEQNPFLKFMELKRWRLAVSFDIFKDVFEVSKVLGKIFFKVEKTIVKA